MRRPIGQLKAEKLVSQILSETVLTLAQAEREIEQVTGHKPSRPTVCRWINSGRLESIKMGRQFFTSKEAIHRFIVDRTAKIVLQA